MPKLRELLQVMWEKQVLLDTISYEVSKAVETQTNVAGRDIMGMGMPTPLPSYTGVEQKEMLAADSDSEWNVVKTNPTRSFRGRISGVERCVQKRMGTNKTDQKENKDPILVLKAKLLCLRRSWPLLTPPTRIMKRMRDEVQAVRQ
jgi:hypothetical protein